MDITSAEFTISSAHYTQLPAPTLPEFAFIGRSNVGKSSLINMLTGRRDLAKTSGKPGKTKLINHFIVNRSWFLVDLPGYGYAKVSKTERQRFERLIQDYLVKRPTLVQCFVLVDGRHPPMATDLEFIRTMGERQVPMAIVLTKADKKGDTPAHLEAYKKALADDWEELPPIFVTSAVKGTGKEEMLAYIFNLQKDVAKHQK